MVFSKQLGKIWKRASDRLTKKGKQAPPLSYELALSFFDELAARKDLAYGYPNEACFARAHLLCEAAVAKGFMPKKAWAVAPDSTALMVFTMPNCEQMEYARHVAMVLPVKTPEGDIHDLIFCPALFDGPVPLKEWGKTLNASPAVIVEIKRLGRPPTNGYGDYSPGIRTSTALSDPNHPRHPLQMIRDYQPMEKIPRAVFASQYCRDSLFPALGRWPERYGNGWISVEPFPKPPERPVPPTGSRYPSHGPKTGG